MKEAIMGTKQRINELHLEHRDLDEVISKLAGNPGQDQLGSAKSNRLKSRRFVAGGCELNAVRFS